MATLPEAEGQQEAMWREVLTHGHQTNKVMRWVAKRLPGPPRCKNCYAPFSGIGSVLLRFTGMRPSRKNPRMCDT